MTVPEKRVAVMLCFKLLLHGVVDRVDMMCFRLLLVDQLNVYYTGSGISIKVF